MNRYSMLTPTILTAALLLGACGTSTPTAPAGHGVTAPAARIVSAPVAGVPDRGYGYPLRIMTRNIYLGAPIGPLLQAGSLAEVPGLVSEMWATVQATDFPSRARLLADEIEAQHPHVVALQEAALYRIQSPGDFVVGNPVAAETVVYDYLQILQDELTARGLDYAVAQVHEGSDVELPSATGDDLRLTDRQAILVRGGVEVQATAKGTYAVNLTVPVGGAGGPEVTLSRGWVRVDARLAGRDLRFVCTHLERASVAPVQVAQGAELAALVAASPRPTIVMGDHNTRADESGTETYANLVASGFVDAWARARPGDDGYTCCHADDLLNPTVDFNRRIDLVFTRQVDAGIFAGASRAVVVGADPAQRTEAGLWPADHAGVALTLGVRATRAWMAARAKAPAGTMPVAAVQ